MVCPQNGTAVLKGISVSCTHQQHQDQVHDVILYDMHNAPGMRVSSDPTRPDPTNIATFTGCRPVLIVTPGSDRKSESITTIVPHAVYHGEKLPENMTYHIIHLVLLYYIPGTRYGGVPYTWYGARYHPSSRLYHPTAGNHRR